MKAPLMPIIASAALCSLAFASCSHRDSTTASSGPMEVDVAFPQVDSLVLHQDYPGYISASSSNNVYCRVNGMVTQLYTDGQHVEVGQPLFSIESSMYVDRVHSAEAALQTAIANNEYAAKQYEAMKKALESDAVSKMEVNQAESNLHETEAAIKSARAALQTARTTLGYCTVKAPIAGTATSSFHGGGDYVSGEGAPVAMCKIFNDDDIFVNFSVSESQYLELTQTAQGKQVDLSRIPVVLNDTLAPKFYAPLNYTSPQIDKTTGTVTLRLKVANPDHALKDGMFATVQLPYAVNPRAIVIHDSAIGTDQLGKYIYTVNDSNRIVYTPVTVGELYQDTLRIINSGITPDTRYVTKAMMKVRQGMDVRPSLPARKSAK